MKKPAPCILHCDKTLQISENTRLLLLFSTCLLCSEMPVVFYHSVIHGSGFFICEILEYTQGVKALCFSILQTSNPVIVLEDDEKLILKPYHSLSDSGIGK